MPQIAILGFNASAVVACSCGGGITMIPFVPGHNIKAICGGCGTRYTVERLHYEVDEKGQGQLNVGVGQEAPLIMPASNVVTPNFGAN